MGRSENYNNNKSIIINRRNEVFCSIPEYLPIPNDKMHDSLEAFSNFYKKLQLIYEIEENRCVNFLKPNYTY